MSAFNPSRITTARKPSKVKKIAFNVHFPDTGRADDPIKLRTQSILNAGKQS